MKKKLLVSTLLFSVLVGMTNLNAVSNSVQIKKENYAVKTLSSDGANILNTINTEKSDLANGKVAIDIVIDNSKDVEVFYVIDNSSTMSSIKGNVIDTLKTSAKLLDTRNGVTQGVVTTTDGNTSLQQLDKNMSETYLNNVKTSTVSSQNGEIFDALEKASEGFTKSEGQKIIILVVNNLGEITETDSYKAKVDAITSKGIQIYAYSLDMADKTNFNAIFSTANRIDVVSTNLNTLNPATVVATAMPSVKDNIVTTVTFDDYILDNFNIVEVKATKGSASYDTTSKTVTWNAGNIEANEKVTLSYYLQIKDVVDQNIVENVTLRTNRQIKVSQNGTFIGTYPSDAQIEDQVCSPTIIILKEKIVNPQTGIAEYIIAGACMLSVGLVTLVIMNSKNEFKRI